jgi:hypothetical protein
MPPPPPPLPPDPPDDPVPVQTVADGVMTLVTVPAPEYASAIEDSEPVHVLLVTSLGISFIALVFGWLEVLVFVIATVAKLLMLILP